MGLNWIKFGNEFFLIKRGGESGIVYAPLLGKFFSVDTDGIELIEAYIREPEKDIVYQHLNQSGFFDEVTLPTTRVGEEYRSSELYLSLTYACNMRCPMCYARAGELRRKLAWSKIEKSIDQLFLYAQEAGESEVEVTFHGTGESTVEWDTLVKSVEYALSKLPEDWKIFFSLVTNGVLLDEEKVSFLTENRFSITVSVDGLEDTQNAQRPMAGGGKSFEHVQQALRRLVAFKADFGVRTTITGSNQPEMIEFVQMLAEVGCKVVYLVPFSPAGRGEEGILPVDHVKFVEDYLALLDMSEDLGIEVHTLSDDISRVSAGFCDADGAIFAVMPDGDITSCTRVTRADDELADKFFIGEVTAEGVFIELDKVAALRELNVYAFEDCNTCFAKYVCSGGCHADRLSGILSVDSCYITREVVWAQLSRRLSGV